ncbi:MAG: GDP-mannose 4,6-dehydratase, partial [Nostoc sp.]
YGDGKNVRDWLYVGDHCRALDVVINHGKAGETYNIGGNNEVENINLVQLLCQMMDELAPDLPVHPAKQLITFVKDRQGHDQRYAINANKIKTQLGWTPSVTIGEGLRLTIEWYLNHRDWWEPLLSAEYQAYYRKNYL